MRRETLYSAALPAVALPVKHFPALRHLCPADRFGYEDDAVVLFAFAPASVQPYDELHVLAHGGGEKSTCLNERFAVENAERTRDKHQRIEETEGHPAAKKRAQIFDGLEQWEHRPRRRNPRHFAVFYAAAIDHANDAAAGQYLSGILKERFHYVHQRVLFEEGI